MNDHGFKDFVLDQLHELSGVTCRAMFGGYGLYRGKTFFGIIHHSRLYLKTDEAGRAAYLNQGMKPFRPNAKQILKTYYEVPPEVLEDGGQLIEWAQKGLHGQSRQKPAPPLKNLAPVSRRSKRTGHKTIASGA